MRRCTIVVVAMMAVGAFASGAAADAAGPSSNASCVGQFVSPSARVITPYGTEFVAPLAQAPGPLGQIVSAIATACQFPT